LILKLFCSAISPLVPSTRTAVDHELLFLPLYPKITRNPFSATTPRLLGSRVEVSTSAVNSPEALPYLSVTLIPLLIISISHEVDELMVRPPDSMYILDDMPLNPASTNYVLIPLILLTSKIAIFSLPNVAATIFATSILAFSITAPGMNASPLNTTLLLSRYNLTDSINVLPA